MLHLFQLIVSFLAIFPYNKLFSNLGYLCGITVFQIEYMETSAKDPPVNVDKLFHDLVRFIRYVMPTMCICIFIVVYMHVHAYRCLRPFFYFAFREPPETVLTIWSDSPRQAIFVFASLVLMFFIGNYGNLGNILINVQLYRVLPVQIGTLLLAYI